MYYLFFLFVQIFWDLNELHMVRNSSVCNEAIEQREQAKKEFSAAKPVHTLRPSLFLAYLFPLACLLLSLSICKVLERFPHLFGEIKLEDFMHASALGIPSDVT